MNRGVFTASSFNIFFSVIPSAASICHQNSNQYARSQCTANQTAQSFSTKQEAHSQRSNDSDYARHNHFVQSSSSGNINAFLVVSFSFAFQQARNFVELTTNFLDHLVSSFTNRFHGHSTEYERQSCTDEQTNQGYRVQQVNSLQLYSVSISREQSQCSQCSRADSKAFTDSSGGVTNGVQFISDFTNFVRQFRHFCDTASVISDRTISVNSYSQTSGGQHTNSSQCDTEQAIARILSAAHAEEGQDYTYADEYHRQEGGVHAYSQTRNDGGSRTSFRLNCDLFNRCIISRGVDFGDFTNQQTNNQTGSNSNECSHVTEDGGGQIVSSSNNDDTTNIGTLVQSCLRISGFAVTSIHNTNDGSNDTSQSQFEYEHNAFATRICYSTQSNSGDNCTNIGFE